MEGNRVTQKIGFDLPFYVFAFLEVLWIKKAFTRAI